MRQTSVDAYNTIKADGLLGKRQFEVYNVLYFDGPLTAHEIVTKYRVKYPNANQTGFNARLSELKKKNVVIEVGTKKNPVSGKKNYLWDVTANLPVKWEKPKHIKCKSCNGKGYITEQQAKLF